MTSGPAVDASIEDALAHLVTLMQEDSDPFVVTVADSLEHMLGFHCAWSHCCKAQHWDTDLPCPEFEQGAMMAMAWAASRLAVQT